MVMEEFFLELPESKLSRKARKQVFQTPEGLAASISTDPIHPSGGGFLDQITSERVQTNLRYLLYREITPVNSLPAWEICMFSKTLCVLDLAEPVTDIHYHSGDCINSVKTPAVLLLAFPITAIESVTWAIGLVVSPVSQVMLSSREHDLRYQKAVESCNGGYRARSITCIAGEACF